VNNSLKNRCSGRFSVIVVDALKETIGPDRFADLVQRHPSMISDDSLADLSFQDLHRVFEQEFGLKTAGGIFLRAGRSAFGYFVKQFDAETGFEGLEFRLKPTPKRILTGLKALANIFNQECGSAIEVTVEGDSWSWADSNCSECNQERPQAYACHFTTGLLQEYLSWISGGRIFQLKETAGRANGAAVCLISIHHRPLD